VARFACDFQVLKLKVPYPGNPSVPGSGDSRSLPHPNSHGFWGHPVLRSVIIVAVLVFGPIEGILASLISA
jgi:hypothetical protein